MSAPLSLPSVFGWAWTAYPSQALRLLALLLGWALVWVVIEVLVITSGSAPGRPIWILLHLGYFWGTAYWEVAILGSALACVDGRPPAPSRLLRDHRLVARFLVLKLVLGPLALVATAFLVVPGLLVMARLGLSLFFVVDRDLGPWAALAASRHTSRGSTAQLVRLLLMLLLVNAIGAAILGLGLVITIPMTTLAGAYVFRAVTSKAPTGEAQDGASP